MAKRRPIHILRDFDTTVNAPQAYLRFASRALELLKVQGVAGVVAEDPALQALP